MGFPDLRSLFQNLFRSALLIVIPGIILVSCGKNEARDKRPKVLVGQQTLVKVLADVHLIEAAMNMRRNNGQAFENLKNALFDSVFVQYRLTPQLLEENLLYYNQQPQIMEKIYQDVIDSLVVMQKNLKLDEGMPR